MQSSTISNEGTGGRAAHAVPGDDLHFRLEAHSRAATLYLSGPLTVAGALRALRLCDRLPPGVTELRVDLRGTTLADPTPVQAVAMLLARWRRAGSARRSRIELPPATRRPPATPPRAKQRPAKERPAKERPPRLTRA